ncbi:GntR family transcriptional regulator [Devosia neptuniae]|jgi:DNA-binding transcriptional regulator YhcF (GntR family)|uniref:GntR family transcriptional regulator n=1 Tax=Devosia neptuniae TaxID=191302 RepID=UPI0022AFC97A|nr:GntR family transcriptional regulator [Devosia neptuniae]MCZ4344406.1 GntR family transcriptional regulator [Devosia neptuniae]|tara:strand:- start:18981 stop:20027 length:1047 start_codon:yes stop_codon:yes gene_type:complete
MFPIDASSIDKSLPVPVGTQLHGLLSYTLAFGGMADGTKLPSVRQLAADLGIAPMTVSQVYQQLRDEGLVEMRHGLGAFTMGARQSSVSEHQPINALRADIEAIIGRAESLGVSTMALVSMISAQAQLRRPTIGLSTVFVCIFEGPGRDYVAQIRPSLGVNDTMALVTLDSLREPGPERDACLEADLVITFAHREAEVRALVGIEHVLGLRFLPSQGTRQNLAGIDPRARVAAVTHFQEYIAIMRPSVREFAPHVSDIVVTWSSAPDLRETLLGCDVVIYASGADHIIDLVRPNVRCFEYRHAPDPGALENIFVPHLAELRQQRIAKESGGGAKEEMVRLSTRLNAAS